MGGGFEIKLFALFSPLNWTKEFVLQRIQVWLLRSESEHSGKLNKVGSLKGGNEVGLALVELGATGRGGGVLEEDDMM